jgi:3-phenylpropionate/trans-cinnamate dioxygenase ferredoxin reductase component
MPERSVEFLVVGGGMAGGNCARHLREEGADGDILLVSREPDPPYNRPPLSKGYLRGKESREEVLFRPPEWYAEQRIELAARTSVMSLDAEARTVKLSNRDVVRFEKALLATGSNVRILRVDGAQLDGIHYLRTLGNSDALREEAQKAERVALIGGSYIGTELAASFTELGLQCELIMLESTTLERMCGPEVGRFFQDTLTSHGVRVHGSQELERFEGAGDRVERVVTKSGLVIECDFVVIGAGVTPDIAVAQRAGLEVDTGVLTDRCLETSAAGIFAAGDIAEYDSVLHDRRLRIEHWDVAFNQGKYAALNMLGRRQEYDVVPYFWSDLADWTGMEYVGPAAKWDEVWLRGSLAEGNFTAFYVQGARLAAALTVGRSDDLAVAARLLREKTEMSALRARIEDPAADIAELG